MNNSIKYAICCCCNLRLSWQALAFSVLRFRHFFRSLFSVFVQSSNILYSVLISVSVFEYFLFLAFVFRCFGYSLS